MQAQEKAPLNNKYQWLETVESFAVIGSIGGTIASIILQQAALASVPLSLSVMLNVVNRRLLFSSLAQSQQSAIAQAIQGGDFITQDQFTPIRNQLAQLQEKAVNLSRSQDNLNDAIAQIKHDSITPDKFEQMSAQLALQVTPQSEPHAALSDSIQNLIYEQANITKTLQSLKEIEICSQAIQLNPNSAIAYYNRGSSYEYMSEKQAAIADYSAAIQLDSNYAEAYYQRGLAYIELGNRKAAIKDLRAAAKFFFAQGDIDKYQQAKDLTKQLHELNPQSNADNNSAGVINSLFATASS